MRGDRRTSIAIMTAMSAGLAMAAAEVAARPKNVEDYPTGEKRPVETSAADTVPPAEPISRQHRRYLERTGRIR